MPRIIDGVKFDFRDMLMVPKRSTLKSRADVDLNRELVFKHSKQRYNGIPIVASNMDTVGTFEMALTMAEFGCFTTVHKWYSLDQWKDFGLKIQDQEKLTKSLKVFENIAVSSGAGDDDFGKMREILEALPEIKYICLDVANGYSEAFVDIVRRVREQFDKHTIFAGNVVTAEMVEQLILTGADVVKVGIGPGSVCTTRSKAGVGYPQFSAVMECADAAHGLSGQIISDGGCTCPGDVAKAFGAGADFVMLGGLLAGHDQSGGEIIEKDGRKFKQFYGMASATAMKKHQGGIAEYRASEGKTISIPYRGDAKDTIQDILGGIRSACTYTGAPKLKELPKRATFVQVRQTTNEVYAKFEI